MNLLEFRRLANSETKALRYVERVCESIGPARCPRSTEKTIVYRVEGGKRRRCGTCGHTFSLVSGRWLSRVKIPFSKWLWIVKLYEMEMTAKRIAEETGVSYPSVLKAVDAIRSSILTATDHGNEIPAGKTGFDCGAVCNCSSCGGSDGEHGVIGIPKEEILSIRELSWGCIVYTSNKVKGDFIVCGGKKHYNFATKPGPDGYRIFLASNKGRWSFIKERLAKHHGVREDLLPVQLAVLDYHFEHHGKNFFELLMENLCSFIPPGPGELQEAGGFENGEFECIEIS